MNTKPIEQAKTQDLAKSLPALRRAAQRAQTLAKTSAQGAQAGDAQSHPSRKKPI